MQVLDLFRGGLKDLQHRPPGNIAALDLLRSLAILLVFSTHFGSEFQATPLVSKIPLLYFGWTGVDLFFVLSGLLISTQLWKEIQKTGKIQIGRFLLRRGLRIWPLYYSFVLLVLFEVIFFGRPFSGLQADMTCLSNYFHHQVGGGWSLSTEEQFYILAPVLISLLAWKLKPTQMWILPIAGMLTMILSRGLAISSSTLSEPDLRLQLYYPIHTHADGLAIGMLLAWFQVFRPDLFRSTRFRILGSAGMVLLSGVLYVFGHVLFNFTALALAYGAATWWGVMLNTASRIINWKGFYLISRLSYGIYLNHFGLLPRLHSVLGEWRVKGGEPAFWACYLLCFLASLAFAALTFHLIEWPFLVLRSRWQKRQAAIPVQVTTQLA